MKRIRIHDLCKHIISSMLQFSLAHKIFLVRIHGLLYINQIKSNKSFLFKKNIESITNERESNKKFINNNFEILVYIEKEYN